MTMTATPLTPDLTLHRLDETLPAVAAQEIPSRSGRSALAGKLYRFHGLRVIDVEGCPAGIVDWIWTDEAGARGDFIGVQLQWLRGTARAVPARELHIDLQSGTIQVACSREQIKRAPRFAIDRPLTSQQRQSIHSHYSPRRDVLSTATMTEGRAA